MRKIIATTGKIGSQKISENQSNLYGAGNVQDVKDILRTVSKS
jgi:hypothetical protein